MKLPHIPSLKSTGHPGCIAAILALAVMTDPAHAGPGGLPILPTLRPIIINPPSAYGYDHWINPLGGSWTDPTNWGAFGNFGVSFDISGSNTVIPINDQWERVLV